MHEAGYLSVRPQRRGVLTGVVAVHVAGAAALLLAAPVVEQAIETSLRTRNIPMPTDPKPIPPQKKIAQAAARQRPVEREPVAAKPAVDRSLVDDTGPIAGTDGESGTGNDETVFRTIEPPRAPVIVSPQLSGRNVQPPYPPGLQRMEIEGSVTLRVLVGVDGRPIRIEVVRTDHEAFFTATRDWAMRHWRFTPATRDGAPLEAWRTLTVRFAIAR